MVAAPSQGPQSSQDEWTEVPRQEVDEWTERLLLTEAQVSQYPYWNEPYRTFFDPVYLVYRINGAPVAYVCILTLDALGFRIGLVFRGPVSLVPDQPTPQAALQALIGWAREKRFVFLRFNSADADLLERLEHTGPSDRIESFPFYRDAASGTSELVVDQLPQDAAMLAGFDREVRRKIRRASEVGYDLHCSDTPEAFSSAWEILVRCARRKQFTLHRPLSSYLETIAMARRHGCVRIYSAWLDGKPVQANLVLLSRDTALCHLAGLDLDALQGRPSPSVLLHWHAMRDLYRNAGIKAYNFGCASGGVEQFKQQFSPRRVTVGLPLTLIVNASLYRLWKLGMPASRRIAPTCISLVEKAAKVSDPFPFDGDAQPSPETLIMFKPGDNVQVRSAAEILATLDEKGMHEGLPFMPEMVPFCGQTFIVHKRADKTCEGGLRRMYNTVHLCGLRCNGSAHDGCQGLCTLYWNEAWLRKLSEQETPANVRPSTHDEESLLRKLKVRDECENGIKYICQATAVSRLEHLRRYQLTQYIRDIRGGNVGRREIVTTAVGLLNHLRWLMFNVLRWIRHQEPAPRRERLDLSPYEVVRVRSRKEIFSTLNARDSLRGLRFHVDMLRHCGREYRVLRRIDRLILPHSGRMRLLNNECIVLEGVMCAGNCSFCPRELYHFWREDWLERATPGGTSGCPTESTALPVPPENARSTHA